MWRGKAGQKGGQTKTTPDTADHEGVTCTVFAACLARSMREGGQGKTGRTRPDALFLGSSGISGKRRMDRGGTDRQSTTLMKTRTTRDTTDKAPIKKV